MKTRPKVPTKASDIGETIPRCDTLSTGDSAESVSPVNGDNHENNTLWLSKGNSQNYQGDENNFTFRNLNDAIILSNIGGIIEIPNDRDEDDEDILFAPSTIEERQNENYARKVGIHFSIDKGDYLTLFPGLSDDDYSASVESDFGSSPRYGKGDKELTFRTLYGNVSQILDMNDDNQQGQLVGITTPTTNPQEELITPRTRKAMINHNQIAETLRPIAATLSVDWGKKEYMAPNLARRLRDFEFAQKKRRKAVGISRKWGLLALYDFLTAVREDVEWVEDAAWRRTNCLPYIRWKDYVQSKRRGSNHPIFVYSILFACTITLITSIGINGWSFESFSLNPSFGPSAETLVIMGAKESSLIVNDYQIWRLVTPMFLHGGIIHYLLNCFAIFYIGRAVEKNHGTLCTSILFIIPSVGSVIFSSLFLPQYISVGASGGIFGLIGACIADVVKNRKLLFSDFINKGRSKKHHISVIMILFFDIVVNLAVGLTPFTDNFMHLFGFIFGILCASTMLNVINLFGSHVHRGNHFVDSCCCFILSKFFGVLLSLVIMIVVSVALFKGDGVTSPCQSCGVLSCVSFPPWANYDSRWWYCDECGNVRAFGRISEETGEYYAVELECPNSENIVFNLGDDMDKSHDALEQNLPMFCRQYCLN